MLDCRLVAQLVSSVLVTSTSASSATGSLIVIREGPLSRLVFIPEIVVNLNNPDACIKGAFVYQKKKKGDLWETVRELELKALKAGEGARWEIHSEELLNLWRGIAALWRSYRN